MDSASMHIDFRVKFGEINSNKNKRFTPQEIDWILNDQMDTFVETRSNRVNNTKGEGFEDSQKRLDDIRTVLKEATTDADKASEFGLIPLSLGTFSRGKQITLPAEGEFLYKKLVADSCDTYTPCTNYYETDNRLFSSEHIRKALKDEFHTTHPQSPISEVVGNILRVYENNFTIKHIYIMYVYVYPRIVYNSVDCVLPEHTHREIVDMAVSKVNAVINTGNYEKYLNSISKNE